ncbi:EF-hand calcium-binding domain-containing 1-like [Paramuricea clavata]|uniref:EF-hand calcium-binding domain-containing 1-like n=1 Tax=Paramuricea clavata TaxID=317549 RepID=A0A6S7IE45_PARCT|nr:EF-hand calcium-binding domain-containing 1-like [Paramuricea clavata]CAB4014421.1 EF-hand calcium-binding domain-containing 1-like [Paramuricea clavata]
MTSVHKLSVFTILILCTMYSSVTARGCRYQCGLVCFPCRVQCSVRCTWGKRSAIDKPQNTVRVPLPDQFENYDLDKSGGITLEELAEAINVEEHSKETVKAFQLADKDGDGQIDCSEFKAAPYLFAHEPSC